MAEGDFVRMREAVWNVLKGGGTENSGEETKRRGQAGSRGGCLKKVEGGGGVGLELSYELKLIYEEICSKFFFEIHSLFLGRAPKNS